MRITKLFLTLLIVLLVLLAASCSKLNVPDEYIIRESALLDSLGNNNRSLVLFYTDWCGAADHRIENYYKPLQEKINNGELDLKLILLASDVNIPISEVDEFRELGMECFYIDDPGGSAFINRMSIKSYINELFPDNEVERISSFQYGIPVELLVTDKLEIVNEKETVKSWEYIKEVLELKD